MGRPRQEDIDRRLLAAARRLLTERDYEDVTMEAVAAEADVGKPALYRRWPTKAALVFAATIDASVPGEVPDRGSFRDDLRALLDALVASLQALPRAAVADQIGAMIADPDFSAEVQRRNTDPQQERVDAIWHRAVERGEVDGGIDGHQLLAALASVVLMRTVVYHRPYSDVEIDGLVDAVERLAAPTSP